MDAATKLPGQNLKMASDPLLTTPLINSARYSTVLFVQQINAFSYSLLQTIFGIADVDQT